MGKRGERGRIQGERMALPAGHPFVSVRPSFLPPWLGWRWRWVVIKTKEGELRNSDANARNVIDVPRAACPSVGPSVPPSVRRVRPPIRLFTVVRPIDRGRKERASERARLRVRAPQRNFLGSFAAAAAAPPMESGTPFSRRWMQTDRPIYGRTDGPRTEGRMD